MQVEKCLPEWFVPLLGEWAVEYGAGHVVDLRARSGTQVIWGSGRRNKGFASTDFERALVNKAFMELRGLNEHAAGLIEFIYLGKRRRSLRDVEICYHLSNRAAGEEVKAATAMIYYEFARFKKVA